MIPWCWSNLHPLQSNPDTLLPFKARFTCRILVVLGSRENCLSMGVFFLENSRTFYFHGDNGQDSSLPTYSREQGEHAKGPGPQRSYNWILKHVCRHWEEEHQIDLKRHSAGAAYKMYISYKETSEPRPSRCQVSLETQPRQSPESSGCRSSWGKRVRNVQRDRFKRVIIGKRSRTSCVPATSSCRRLNVVGKPLLGYSSNTRIFDMVCTVKRNMMSQKSVDVVQSVAMWIDDIKLKGGRRLFLSDIAPSEKEHFTIA